MGWLKRMSQRAEQGPTDATVFELNKAEPRLRAKAVSTICPEGHEHYGVIVTLPQSEYLALTRCFPNWYGQMVTRAEAGQFYASSNSSIYRDSSAKREWTRFGPANTPAPAFAHIFVTALHDL